MIPAPRRVAVIGGGWAGLAAAVEARALGAEVTLYETAGAVGGRARRAGVTDDGFAFDNGQHILIGAYRETLRLLALVGVEPEGALHRTPLQLVDAHGLGLRLPPGTPFLSFLRALAMAHHWPRLDRIGFALVAASWAIRRFRCPSDWTVAQLSRCVAQPIRDEVIDPLCIAALNTPALRASATVFLRVMRDALFSSPGASDLLLPRVDLSALWPDAAARWLSDHGVELRLRTRVESLAADEGTWAVDGQRFDAVIVAASALEAARLVERHAARWSACARQITYEPIISVLLRCPGARLHEPMLALRTGPGQPAQYAFDLGALRVGDPAAAGVIALVVSGASQWIERGLDTTTTAVLAQAKLQLAGQIGASPTPLRTLSERRATFACTPGLARPAPLIAPHLHAAGDYVAGPYPATIEGAIRSGVAAARAAAEANNR